MTSIADIFKATLRKNVSWRVYGPNKEYRRPMIHRFPCNTGQTVMDVIADNVTRNNALYSRLVQKGKA